MQVETMEEADRVVFNLWGVFSSELRAFIWAIDALGENPDEVLIPAAPWSNYLEQDITSIDHARNISEYRRTAFSWDDIPDSRACVAAIYMWLPLRVSVEARRKLAMTGLSWAWRLLRLRSTIFTGSCHGQHHILGIQHSAI